MSTHDALDIESATLPGDARSGTEPSGAVESARAATTWRERRFPGVDKPPRQPAKRNGKAGANGDAAAAEGDFTAASATRDAVYRRLLVKILLRTVPFVVGQRGL